MNIKVKNISKKLDNQTLLSNISLELSGGKIYGFVGRNGSGKTILFKSICGFVKPDEGEILVSGKNIYASNSFPESTAAMIENPSYIADLSGFENLKLLADINKKISDSDIIDTLKDVNLYEEKDKKFKKYSLGMKQKLGIAQVLMENPDIMIFDEPFNGLDEDSADKIRNIIVQRKNQGKLILIATHIKEDIENLCDKVFEMKLGTIENG